MVMDVDGLRRQSLWFSRLTLTLFLATSAILAIFVMGATVHPEKLDFFGRLLVRWSPALFYLYALWAIRGGFRDFALGGVFGDAIASGCSRAGWALAIGGTLSAIGVPNLIRILDDAGLLRREPGEWAGLLVFDVAYLAVGVVGLALILLGRLLRLAGETQREAADLRDELGSFF
ncbi:MAG TPA: hypothetical protein VK472_00815 [Allosphingosinicella sp.]|nr:hypothetical protein [Allosphingosinicella sp.]